ncbi:ROK family transcriptional regulator [Nonomuraea diastatica]|uniref:ROK family transcriptional regulator n=1 Tax=Nonomuraea diastatica TaxID=1848329 RepID=A0A4R4WAW0_9ACTN|nr:ROK family transcriptional regulator [Nonomuraea diastatica]TDD14237.1 ROK family transcriptional regulator [Nonomuraea diastatica]
MMSHLRSGRLPDSAVRQESLRSLNLELVFRHIVTADRPISRTELANATGLTRPTITRIVEELLTGRLITESAVTHNGRAGRPRVGLTLSKTGPAGLGLDIRADGLAACVVDLTGTVRQLSFHPAPRSDAPTVLADLASMARAAVAAVAAELTVVNATLAVPGPVRDGVVQSAPALGWRCVDAAGPLRNRLGLPVTVDNEANLAALGEMYAGGPTDTSFVYVSGGLDIGAGIVLEGQLMRGTRGWSGELGHVSVHPDGEPCPCGSRGCLQTYASLSTILGEESAPADVTPDAVIINRAETGAPLTLAALERAGTALGIALSSMLNILDVNTVLLGGSFSLLSSWIIDIVKAEMDRRVLTASWAPIAIRPAVLGPDAAVIGAALTSIDEIRQHPTSWLARQTAGTA